MGFLDDFRGAADAISGETRSRTEPAAEPSRQFHAPPNDTALAGRLVASVPALPPAELSSLGQSLIHYFTSEDAFPGDAHDAAKEASLFPADIANGMPGAVQAFVSYAKNYPTILELAARAFDRKYPDRLGGVVGGGNPPATRTSDLEENEPNLGQRRV